MDDTTKQDEYSGEIGRTLPVELTQSITDEKTEISVELKREIMFFYIVYKDVSI
jgi:hypothetical protein